ncbi:Hypothetical predicted protein [Olea europaea subsp. europaea]|uniref:Uncharacterized protein n=1 Tax=Olea europaea subsp. europaea TaxID=158383 RepID=A0A8S0TCJ6_OLEEU|nr:Hypothetical predicted protein [Olea europaea subsp. europaea]
MAWALETTCTEDDVPTVSRSHDSNVVAQSTMRLDAPAFLPTFSAPPSEQYFSPKQAPSRRCILAVSWTWPTHRVHETAQNCLKIRLRPCLGHDASRTWPAHRVPEIARKLGDIPAVAWMRPGLGLYTVPTNCLQMPKN